MNDTCLMCLDPVSLCLCKTSPLTPDALEDLLRSELTAAKARIAKLEYIIKERESYEKK